MKTGAFLGVSVLVFSASAATGQELPPTLASVVDKQISGIEKQVTETAEAMPEVRFGGLGSPRPKVGGIDLEVGRP
jgi:hypothetical protein